EAAEGKAAAPPIRVTTAARGKTTRRKGGPWNSIGGTGSGGRGKREPDHAGGERDGSLPHPAAGCRDGLPTQRRSRWSVARRPRPGARSAKRRQGHADQ